MLQILNERNVKSVRKTIVRRGTRTIINGSRQTGKTFDIVQELMRTFTRNSNTKVLMVSMCKYDKLIIETELKVRKLERCMDNITLMTYNQYFDTYIKPDTITENFQGLYDLTIFDDADLFLETFIFKSGGIGSLISLNFEDDL